MSNDKNFLHSWEIVEVEKLKLIKYNWRYPEYFEGDSFVTFYIKSIDENRTEVTIMSEGIEKYPNHIPEFTYNSCKAGWEYFMSRLTTYTQSI